MAHWGGTPGDGNYDYLIPCEGDYDKCPGLYAIRCGKYKVHWVTKDYNSTATILETPLLYNIEWDPSEMHPIWPNNS